ncbi:PHP family Zn ribbon phosphoesterase [Mesoflavibacter sabulilitoris]|uniref:Lipoprotein n=1 Tax=Mesoflavibacter zeaxanthinifaciens subsp. sabulilitoris TaxID=1520893 RepID=A0A2T1NNK0_9FLAO|nr:hypothetical protein [Mesoflavibacter zeaxanthinifaciens]MBB3125300.1 PHP family Zn ribbon phosphoesterase [Mesoflavibacter zeaxanthinifaciens subsp. sabulilitoris]PSG94456.1 hypothetical protein C7H61_00930 [Mesoflavibacter zeaxanthinifaciens subsp. sabulilitoris]
MKNSFIILLIILISGCNNPKKKEVEIIPEKEKTESNKTKIPSTSSNESNSEFPNWINKINSEINDELGQYLNNDIEEFNKLNDSLSTCIFVLNDGVCSKYSLATYLNQKEIENVEIGVGCDHDMSIPKYEWQEFEFLSATTFRTIAYSEYVQDSLVDANGNMKKEYDFMESKTKIDSIIKIFEIKKTGKIIERNK